MDGDREARSDQSRRLSGAHGVEMLARLRGGTPAPHRYQREVDTDVELSHLFEVRRVSREVDALAAVEQEADTPGRGTEGWSEALVHRLGGLHL